MSCSTRPEQPELLAATLAVPSHVVYRAFAQETVVLNLRSGKYHGLNATAARMLELLERERRIPAVAEQLAEEYGRTTTEMQDDLCRLCRSLLERGLIEISSNGGA